MKNLLVVLAGAALVAALAMVAGCPKSPENAAVADDSPVVVSAGEVKITESEIRAELEHMDAADRERALSSEAEFKNYLTDQVLGRIMIGEARAAGLAGDSEYRYRMQQAEQSILYGRYLDYWGEKNIQVSDSEVEKFYADNRARFTHGDMIVAMLWVGESREAVQQARSMLVAGAPAWQVMEQCRVQNRPMQFDLGQAPPMQKQLFASLRDGEFSQPLQDEGVWAVVQRVKLVPAGTVPLEEVRDRIVQGMRRERFRTEFRTYTEGLKQQHAINFDQARFAALGVAPAASAPPATPPAAQ